MSVTHRLSDDPADCQRLLDDLLRRNAELRQQAETPSGRPKMPSAASTSSSGCSIRPRQTTIS